MEELNFEAPLAQFENEDFIDFLSCKEYQTLSELKNTRLLNSNSNNTNNSTGTTKNTNNTTNNLNKLKELEALKKCLSENNDDNSNELSSMNMNELFLMETIANANNDAASSSSSSSTISSGTENGGKSAGAAAASSFMDAFSGSLEDLVNTFDEKITKCFRNYDENTETLAPVQMRSQEELMNDCQMWYTITGNYGNILPIDWSKTYTRKLQLPTLNLNEQAKEEEENTYSDEDEAVASDLDMHSLILGRSHEQLPEPPTADEVIKEIDYMMQISEDSTPASECCFSSEDSGTCNCRGEGASGGDCARLSNGKGKQCSSAPFHQEKLNEYSVYELNEILLELEAQIKENSEILIAELAHRDELEYEKELKNSFISHLLAVQSKRRQLNLDRKKNKNGEKGSPTGNAQSKYLTTVIPYHATKGAPRNSTLQVLIKILKAIEQDSPTVPTLLTDYILKVLCPT